MKILRTAAFLIGMMTVSACMDTNPVLTVEGGKIKGVLTDSTNVMVYKGIPYAAPPVGNLKLKLPQPVVPWRGVKIADTFSKICPQAGSPPGTFYWDEFYWNGTPDQSEDCLYLNVWAPAASIGKADAKLPVAMWIHGGAFISGYGHEVTMDGDAWATRGVILVTINYRLGEYGFRQTRYLLRTNFADDLTGRFGIQDQVAALKWIRNNIAQFGGDPDNITIFGQSAGGMSVMYHLAAPDSRGLFAKAIIQSGGGIAPQGFRVLPRSFNDLVYRNLIADVPIMIGYNLNDVGTLGGAPVDRFCAVRDSLGCKPVYLYEFMRNLPGDDDDPEKDPGAFHSAELWYMFHTPKNSWRPFTEADYALSNKMVDHWTSFCKTGDPGNGWEAYKRDAPFKKEFDVE